MRINKNEVLSKYKFMIEQKENNENKLVELVGTYNINVPVGTYGLVRNMSIPEIIQVYGDISNYHSYVEKAKDNLNIPVSLLGESGDPGYLGISIEDWTKEFKTRIKAIDISDKLQKIDKNIALLRKHLSQDDLFDLDMNEIEDVVFD